MLNIILSLTIFDCSIFISYDFFPLFDTAYATAQMVYFAFAFESIFIDSPLFQRIYHHLRQDYYHLTKTE